MSVLSAKFALRELTKNIHLFGCLVRHDVVLQVAMTLALVDLLGDRCGLLHKYWMRFVYAASRSATRRAPSVLASWAKLLTAQTESSRAMAFDFFMMFPLVGSLPCSVSR